VLTSVSWRWCFAINLPVCVIAHIIFFVVLRKRVRTSNYDTAEERSSLSFKLKKIDYLGLTLFLLSCTFIILALVWGGSAYPWSSGRIIALIVLGVIFLGLFVITEWFFEAPNVTKVPAFLRPIFVHGTPMIPLEIFRDWDVTICQWMNLSGGMVMYGQFYYIAIFFTIVFG
jgi:MFS family permease